jgi:L-threonylcarbamoyladenylate synthase
MMQPISKCTQEIIIQAAEKLYSGEIVAFPTETVYGLGVNAENEQSVVRMYKIKGRPLNHPVIVHIADIKDVNHWARDIPEYAILLMRRFWPGPMTLILSRSEYAKNFITGNQDFVGVRIPSNLIALNLLKEFSKLGGHGVAAPSANRFGSVSPTSAKDVGEEIGKLLTEKDLILDGGECEIGLESTIIGCSRALPRILRLGAITEEMIKEVTDIDLDDDLNDIRVSGSLSKHYSPRAQVIINGDVLPGDGYIALSSVITPDGAIRLSAPNTISEYAKTLYSSLRLADSKNLLRIFVVLPDGSGLAAAIRDRVVRASTISYKIDAI